MLALASLAAVSILATHAIPPKPSPWQKEVFYQIFPISFRDSNGDGFGDFKGIQEKLPFLKKLGVTTLLVNPIFKSRFYHKYFADDFMNVDPVFGTNQDWFSLVRSAHREGLKIVLDMEVQYVADKHPWAIAARKNPKSPFAKYLWKDPSFYTSAPLEGYDGQKMKISAVDTANPTARKAIEDVFVYWTKPEGDLSAGVDGFRIDHMMDDFDDAHIKKNMLAGLWAPIIRKIRQIRPGAFFVGEQSDWKTGAALYSKAGVDAVYDFPVWIALNQQRRDDLAKAIAQTPANTPPGKTQLVFIEIHDTERFATLMNGDPSALRMGAVLNFAVFGTPLVYQGQELGMRGKQAHGRSDANDIPQRLGYRWNKAVDAPGTPRWYVGHVPASTLAFSRTGDGISVEEEQGNPGSLLNFYKKLIRLRQSKPALRIGGQTMLALGRTSIIAFERHLRGQKPILVLLNPSPHAAKASWSGPRKLKTLIGVGTVSGGAARLAAYGYWVVEVSSS